MSADELARARNAIEEIIAEVSWFVQRKKNLADQVEGSDRTWADVLNEDLEPGRRALKTAEGQASGEQSPHFAKGQENKPAPAAPEAAPQEQSSGARRDGIPLEYSDIERASPAKGSMPAVAATDDPVAVFDRLNDGRSLVAVVSALAAHYERIGEVKGMRKAAEIARNTPTVLCNNGDFFSERVHNNILSAADELERKP